MKSKAAVAEQFRKHKAASAAGLSRQYALMRDCEAFYVGDIMDYRDKIQFSDQHGRPKRAMVQFNRVKPYVNAVTGFMVQNRKRAKYLARMENEPIQQAYTDYCNATTEYVRQNADADNAESEVAKNMLVGGVGAIETCMVYGDGYAAVDSNGEIRWIPLDGKTTGWDPSARRQNLIDARWVFYHKEYDLEEALALFDNAEEEDFQDASPAEDAGPKRYDRFSSTNYRVLEGYDWASEQENKVKVYFYQWYDVEKFYRADNPVFMASDAEFAARIGAVLEGIAAEAQDEDFDPRAEILTFSEQTRDLIVEQFGDALDVFAFKKKVFYTAILSGKKVFDVYKNVSQQGFTVQFQTGDWDGKNKLWHGMVSSLREPALYYNKALTEFMFLIATNSKGGLMVERGAVDDVRELESRYARTDAVIVVNSGALERGQIQPKKEPFSPSGYGDVITLSDAALADISGIDKTFLGSSENRQETALLQRRRVRQVITTLACYFDSISLYQKTNARLLLDMMVIYAENNPGALIPIIGERGRTEFMRLQADIFMNEYAVDIQEAPQSPEERQELGEIASSMAQALLAVGDPAGKALMALAVKYTTFDEADKQQIQQILMPGTAEVDPAYVQQLEAMVQQLQSRASQVQLEKVSSDTALNIARVEETRAKVQKAGADTVKALEEAEKISVETRLAGSAQPDGVSVVI